MRVTVGSKNDVKVSAVKESITGYDALSEAEVRSLDVQSEVPEQPKSAEETIKGAMNRAKNAFQDCDYSFGIESGLIKVPHTKTGYMDVSACAIYDGYKYHLGLSSAFEYPTEVTRLVLDKGLDINQAFHQTGLTKNKQLGSAEGAIGILTKGRLMRKDYTKQAVMMALIHLENTGLY